MSDPEQATTSGTAPTEDGLASVSRAAPRLVVGGALMGLANLVPGISGGTMLVAAGVYERFIESISDLSRLRLRPAPIVTVGVVVFAALSAIVRTLRAKVSLGLDTSVGVQIERHQLESGLDLARGDACRFEKAESLVEVIRGSCALSREAMGPAREDSVPGIDVRDSCLGMWWRLACLS